MARRGALPITIALVGATAGLLYASNTFLSAVSSRRQFLGAAASGVVVAGSPLPSFADWQGEPARALQTYGSAILRLEDAVDKGDMKVLAKKSKKFELFVGAFRNDPTTYKEVNDIKDDFIDAVAEGKAADAKKAYQKLIARTQLKEVLKAPPNVQGIGRSGARILSAATGISGTGFKEGWEGQK